MLCTHTQTQLHACFCDASSTPPLSSTNAILTQPITLLPACLPVPPSSCLCLFYVQVRGPTYLCDHVKVAAGDAAYTLLAVDLVSTPTAVHHLARFLPSVRCVMCGVVGMCGWVLCVLYVCVSAVTQNT